MITEEHAEKAHSYLMETAQEYANVSSDLNFMKEKIKIVEAQAFNEVEKGGEVSRRMAAKASPEYLETLQEIQRIEARQLYLRAMREAAASKISLFQTEAKSRSLGVML